MAPNKKPNAFFLFTLEWKAKYGRHLSMAEATNEAGKIWDTMNYDERKPYKDKAKQQKAINSNKNYDKRYTCNGIPISHIDKEKKEMELKENRIKNRIEHIVKSSVKNAELEHQKYYFIMINYFGKTSSSGFYLPAELALCEFSLKLGIIREYHTLINPDVDIYGYRYDAKHYSESTHNLPLPPNALGDKNLGNIYDAILDFIMDSKDEKSNNNAARKYPELYTTRENIHIIESCLEFLQAEMTNDDIKLDIYPIQYLYYQMKLATCDQGEVKNSPKNFYISDVHFEKDPFEYQPDIACEFHEENDRTKYCAKSIVTRWAYTFSDYMCHDIAIKLLPGRHVPKNTCLDAVLTSASMASSECGPSTSYAIHHADSDKSQFDPNNGTTSRKPLKTVNSYRNYQKRHEFGNNINIPNICNSLSRHLNQTFREPEDSDFRVEPTLDSDTQSISSYGRGHLFWNK